MAEIRQALDNGNFATFKKETLEKWGQ